MGRSNYKTILENYIYDGLKRDLSLTLKLAEQGVMSSFKYINSLHQVYNFLKITFEKKEDIELMLCKIDKKNREIFQKY